MKPLKKSRAASTAVPTEALKVSALLKRLALSAPRFRAVVEEGVERYRAFYSGGPFQFPAVDSLVLRAGIIDELAKTAPSIAEKLVVVAFPTAFDVPPNESLHRHMTAVDFFPLYLRRKSFLFASRHPERQWIEAKMAFDRPLWLHYADAGETLSAPPEKWIGADGFATEEFRRVHDYVYESLPSASIEKLKGRRTSAFVSASKAVTLSEPLYSTDGAAIEQGPDLSFARLMQRQATLCSPLEFCALLGAYSEAGMPRTYFAYGEPEWLDAITPTGALVAYSDMDGVGLYDTPYDAWTKCNRARQCIR